MSPGHLYEIQLRSVEKVFVFGGSDGKRYIPFQITNLANATTCGMQRKDQRCLSYLDAKELIGIVQCLGVCNIWNEKASVEGLSQRM